MNSSFTQQPEGESTVNFTVTPGSIRNTAGGIALAAVVGILIGFSGGPDGFGLRLLIAGAIAYGVHWGLIQWRTSRANAVRSPGGSFRVSREAIVLPSGESLARADIRQVITVNTLESNGTSYIIGADTTSGPHILAGGMDLSTVLDLQIAVCALLGIDQEKDSSPV